MGESPKRDKQSGSAMSSKQLTRTVTTGCKITLSLPQGELEGYLAGMDDFHWLVVTPSGQKHLVHKGSASRITLTDEPTYQDEPNQAELERVIGPFRAWVQRQVLGQTPIQSRELSA